MNDTTECVQNDCAESTNHETFVAAVRRFTELAGCTTDRFNVRQTALYIGLQCEELGEKLEACRLGLLAERLYAIGREFKEGEHDDRVNDADRADMLDADVDLAWVTVGAALSSGADVLGAMREVARANLDKFPGGVVTKDANGKVVKPEGWRAPDITPFVCEGGDA